MKWMLFVLALGATPIPTGLVYDSLAACYAAEDEMAAEYAKYYNDWVARNKQADAASKDFIMRRLMRGICVPHGNDK